MMKSEKKRFRNTVSGKLMSKAQAKVVVKAGEWARIRFDFGWRKISAKHWWAHDLGSATKTPEGWVASASAYEHVILDPKVGPFKTAQEAMVAWTSRTRSLRAGTSD